jgi:hypothetical protein
MIAAVQGEILLLDAEMPTANWVVTARALAWMCGAIAKAARSTASDFCEVDW